MLENSVYLDGQGGKELNSLLSQYQELDLQVKDLTTTKTKVTDRIKELCGKGGTFESTDYVLTLTEVKEKYSLDSKTVEKKYPEIYQECCTKYSAGYIRMGTVIPKTKTKK